MCSSCGVQVVLCVEVSFAVILLTGGQQFVASPLGEALGSHGGERVVGEPKLLARVDSPTLAAKPLAVQQARAGQVWHKWSAGQAINRGAIPPFGLFTRGH